MDENKGCSTMEQQVLRRIRDYGINPGCNLMFKENKEDLQWLTIEHFTNCSCIFCDLLKQIKQVEETTK